MDKTSRTLGHPTLPVIQLWKATTKEDKTAVFGVVYYVVFFMLFLAERNHSSSKSLPLIFALVVDVPETGLQTHQNTMRAIREKTLSKTWHMETIQKKQAKGRHQNIPSLSSRRPNKKNDEKTHQMYTSVDALMTDCDTPRITFKTASHLRSKTLRSPSKPSSTSEGVIK